MSMLYRGVHGAPVARLSRRGFLLTSLAPGILRAAGPHPIPALRAALDRQYNFDFPGAHRLLDSYVAANPSDPLGHAFRASAYLFSELDRLHILESEFLASDEKIQRDDRSQADPRVRQALFASIDLARKAAEARAPGDPGALFALCATTGMTTDYLAFVEKRRIGSLSYARQSQNYALELMKIDPSFVDAKLTNGISEYLIGSLPFFLRWFVRFPQTEGSKPKAIENLVEVGQAGYYLGPFARILLAIVYLREGRPRDSARTLAGLVNDFPENPLLRKELAKLRMRGFGD